MKQVIMVVVIGMLFFSCIDNAPKGLTVEEQFEADLMVIDNFLTQNDLTAEIEPIYQLRYIISVPGEGELPTLTDSITINYEGRLLSTGVVFDQNDSITFFLGSLIPAWQIGLPLLNEGGSMTLYVPSFYGYGNANIPGIPPGSILIFDIDLIEVK
ncbi:MAG: FKBP-type peptidyl-prolyl cis-trans isomerase [Bacteroidetes bacterium]|nr:FKBP-type peptidyl-prolyl cis-trans isomerase [Bacteroidota bacterium]MDA1120092.1 FKBP-type peptidyl-prolyl cis-trans isomerase [Bacteroidota bacterium]